MTSTVAPDLEVHDFSDTDLADVNVLISIDAETILSKFGKNSNSDEPQYISNADDYITMLVRQKNVIEKQKASELHVKLPLQKSVRWRGTTLTMNSEYTCLLYKHEMFGTNNEIISDPQPYLVQGLQVPLPNKKDPLNPTTQKINSYFWGAVAEKEGSQNYYFRFMILNRTGEKQGYYKWDPKITVTQS